MTFQGPLKLFSIGNTGVAGRRERLSPTGRQEAEWRFVHLFVFPTMLWNRERKASSVLNYDSEKALSCGLVKSHLEYHSQVGAPQPLKEGST